MRGKLILICLFLITILISNVVGASPKTPQKRDELDCISCKFFLELVGNLFKMNTTESDAEKIIYPVCADLLKVEDDRVCKGILAEFVPWLFDVLSTGVNLDSNLVCGNIGYCSVVPIPFVWNPVFPKPKPPYVPPHVVPGENYYILHLSDIHYDPRYLMGAPTNCGEPLCCRKSDNGTGSAGKWGDYNCDLNPDLLNWSMNYFNTSLPVKPKFVVMTGDLPPHNVWNQTDTTNLDFSLFISQVLLDTFQNLDIPVFTAIGNHEGSPVNNFRVNKTSWLYAPIAQKYSKWLTPEAVESFSQNGFYTQLVEPGLRILSMNDNFCNSMNFWNYLNETDPANMLQWTINTLQSAEDNKEKVFILAHIPTGIDCCIASWGNTFYKIVNRYENTISAMFMGHTHKDHFQVFYENGTNSRATAITYVAPSLTTFTNINPSYRIYTVDQKTNFIVDTDTYHVNLTLANRVGPSFKHEYSAKSTYNMTNLFPQDWADLVTRMEQEDSLLQTYHYYKYTSTDTKKCEGECKVDLLCSTKSGSYSLYKDCVASNNTFATINIY